MFKGKLFVILLVFASAALHAQQNFINVPSSEITKKGKVFFQQQFNFNELIQANSTFDYGLGKGFEAGFNILGLNYNEKGNSFFNNDTNDRDPYSPLIILNAAKQFELSPHTSLQFGVQSGINIRKHRKTTEAGLVYANFAIADWLGKDSRLVFGPYYNSRHYGGVGNRVGAWAGVQIPITEKFHGMAETVIGTNAIAFTTVAAMYFPRKWLPLTLGLQIPNTPRNAYSIVFEITFVPQ